MLLLKGKNMIVFQEALVLKFLSNKTLFVDQAIAILFLFGKRNYNKRST